MITHIKLTNFKGFQAVDIPFGPLTFMFGANASGKSNIGDALRFLHGIARGYTLAEIVGGKYVGGGLEWHPIRGGPPLICFQGQSRFEIEVGLSDELHPGRSCAYRLGMEVRPTTGELRVVMEQLLVGSAGTCMFETEPESNAPTPNFSDQFSVRLKRRGQTRSYSNDRPALVQIANDPEVKLADVVEFARATVAGLSRFRFPQFDLGALHQSSYLAQTSLGDRGDNLPSVLRRLSDEPPIAAALNSWLQELTPMDAIELDFQSVGAGRVGLALKEKSGRGTPVDSASDGTLLFLAYLAILFGAEHDSLVFLDEPENGIHPARIELLLRLFEQRVRKQRLQIVATSHSPTLFAMMSTAARGNALVVFRAKGHSGSSVRRALAFPHAAKLVDSQSPADLLAEGWFENVAEFEAADEAESA